MRLHFKSDVVQSAFAFLIKLGAGASSYFLFVIAARVMGDIEFGLFISLFSAVMIIGMLSSFGQEMFLIKQIPKEQLEGNPCKALGTYIFSAKTTTSVALIGSSIFFIYSLHIDKSVTFGGALMGGLLCFVFALSQATMGALRAQEKSLFATATRDMVWRVLIISFFVVLFWANKKLDIKNVSASQGFLIMTGLLIPILLVQLKVIIKHIRRHYKKVTPKYRTKSWLETSFGLMFAGFISSSDIYLYTIALGYLLSHQEAGAFFASLKTVELLNLFFMAVSLIVSPKISQLISSKNRIALQQKCNGALLLQGIPAIFCAGVLFIFAPVFLSIFNPEFESYAIVLRFLIIGMMINALTGPTVLMMQVGGMHWRQVTYQGGSLCLSLILLPILTPNFGVLGAAMSFILSKALWNCLAISAIKKSQGVNPSLLGLFNKESGGIRSSFAGAVSGK